MKRLLIPIIGLLFSVSCEKKENIHKLDLCEKEYFYYSGGSKNYLKHSLTEIWIEFEQKDVTREYADSILSRYAFINSNIPLVGNNNYNQIPIKINRKCDCDEFKNFLVELNKDYDIFSATPFFYLSDYEPESYWILLSEVLTKNNENQISELDFINYAETLNLELIESTNYSTQRFNVKEVKTGFEALEIANQIYESGIVEYSHPNFIAKIVLN